MRQCGASDARALFNIPKKYYPECTYYTEETVHAFADVQQAAGFYAPDLQKETGCEEAEERILTYLQENYPENQPIYRPRVTKYGWILWNVNERHQSVGGNRHESGSA